MEPITTWMMATLLAGWIGNRGDFWLCKGYNKLRQRITENIHEPANHHIQRAIRKSYLNTTLLAVVHIQEQRKRFSLTDRSWTNLEEIKDHIKGKVERLDREEITVRSSPLDGEYRELLFPREGASAGERMPELIQKLKDSVILELESNQLRIENELKSCIYEGWKDGHKEMDFYQLVCAFFTQELKDNSRLSTFIQTEYLDHIAGEVGDVSLKVDDLREVMKIYYELYRDILGKVDEILETVTRVEQKLDNIPQKTAELINKSIQDHLITPRQITLSEEYQKHLKALEDIEGARDKFRNQIDGIKRAIPQVDEHTRPFLEQNLSGLESELLSKGIQKEAQEHKLNDFIENVVSLAKQLQTSRELDSERLKKARALFEEGRYEELDEVLNEKEIDQDILRYKEQGKTLANELTIKAQVILVNKPEGWFEEADRIYAKAMSIIEDYNTTFNYAYFLQEHRQIHRAASIYEKNISHCSNPALKANTLNNLAVLQSDKNEFDKAELSYLEALGIRRKLADENPKAYLADVAMTLNNLANLQKANNEFGKAELSYLEALEIYRKLADENPQAYLAYVAGTLNNLAVLQSANNEFGKAELSYLEALEIRRKLADENPQTYLAYVATTLNNLAVLQSDKNEFGKAELSYLESLEIYRKLADENPPAYLAYVATTLNNLAVLQSDKNEIGKAELSYLEALEIRGKLADENPQAYLADVALTLNNLANLQSDKNETGKAEFCYFKALEIYRKLADENPKAYLAYVAGTLNNLAVLQKAKNEFGKAELSYLEALEIYRKLADETPPAYLANVATTLNNLANLQSNKNEFGKAELSFLEALEIYRKLADENPPAYLANVATTLNNLANLQSNKNEFGKAELSFLEALEIRSLLADQNPNAFLILYADTSVNFSIFYLQRIADKQKSTLYAQKALEAYSPFVPRVPHAVKFRKVAEEILAYWKENG